jgi:CarboxypepD_reg-like domain
MINYLENKLKPMIITIIIMGFSLFANQICAQNSSPLDSIITFKAKNINLDEILNEIGSITGYEFSYNSDLVKTNTEIKGSFENISVRNLLKKILNDTSLECKIIDKQIVICKKNSFNQLVLLKDYQEISNSLTINGTIVDIDTKIALSYANVSVFNKSIGTVSNEHGQFVLKLPLNEIIDTIVISYIGYKNAFIPIKQLSLSNNTIYLKEDPFLIKEITIRGTNAEKILQQSIEKIKDNYYTDPYYITSFYREIVTEREELASITEAVMDVYKSPYSGLFSDQIKLLKSRKNEYYTSEDTVSLKLQGGMSASLYLDLIKNPLYFLIFEQLRFYNYSLKEIVNYNNGTAYVIDFKPKIYIENNAFEGVIYINTEDLAIVAIEISLSPEGIQKAGRNLIVQRSFRTRVKTVSASYLINYRKIDNKYFVNMTRGELNFKIKYKRKLFSTDFKTVFEFAVNNIDTIDVSRFNRIETISPNKVFIDEDFKYDQDFWGDYNYISPNESLEEALIRIEQKVNELKEE